MKNKLLRLFKRSTLDRVMVNLTWYCNLGSCPYCWLNTVVRNSELIKVKDRGWKEWVIGLNGLDSAVLDFVGGEPTSFLGIVELIHALDMKHKWALTSNLHNKQVLTELSKENPKNCVMIVGSYHPTGNLSIKDFYDNLNIFRRMGFPVSVNIINHQSITKFIPNAVTFFSKRKITVHVSPYEHPPDLETKKPLHHLKCNAGLTHYVINNNGDVYRCLSWFRSKRRSEAVLGNIFDNTFKKYTQRQVCDLFCEMFYVVSHTNTMRDELQIKK